MKIIGISCFYHDSAIAYVEDGVLKSAVQEERFSRKKHHPEFPFNALFWTLENFKLNLDDIDSIAFYEKPALKLERIKHSHISLWPFSYKNYIRDLK